MDQRLGRHAHSIDEVFGVIRGTRSGAYWLARLRPWRAAGKIRVELFPDELQKRLRAIRRPGEPNGAVFVTDGTEGFIYVDLNVELAVVAAFLVHEIVHSLDQALWRAASLPAVQRGPLILESEVRAYAGQRQFLDELTGREAGLADLLRARYPSVRILHDSLSRDEIAELYGLRAAS